MKEKRQLVTSSVLQFVSLVIHVAVALALMPFIVRSLGDRVYGVWALIGDSITYFNLLDLGISSAVSRYVSRALGKKDASEMNGIISTSLAFFMGAALIVLLVSALLAFCSPLWTSDALEQALYFKVILILGATAALGFPVRVFTGVLQAFIRHDLIVYSSLSRLAIQSGLMFWVLYQGHGILLMSLVVLGSSIVEYLLVIGSSRIVFGELRLRPSSVTRARMKTILAYSSKSFVAQIADMLRYKLDLAIIAAFLGATLVAYYSVASRLTEYFNQLVVKTLSTITPVFSRLEGEGDFEVIRKTLLAVLEVSTAISVYIGLCVVFYGKEFIVWWIGPEFGVSYQALVILCLCQVVALVQSPSIFLLYGISKHHFYAVSNIVEGVLNVVLSLFLVGKLGLLGVALGTAIPMVLIKVCVQPFYVCRIIELSIIRYASIIFRTSLSVLVPAGAYYWLTRRYLEPTLISIVAHNAGCLLVTGSIYLFLSPRRSEIWNNKAAPRSER